MVPLQRAAAVFMRHPADSVGALLIGVAAMVICVNALALQSGPHPAPMLRMDSPVDVTPAAVSEKTGSVVAAPAPAAAARVRDPIAAVVAQPAEAARLRTQLITDIQRELADRGFYEAGIDGLAGPKMDAAIRDFAQAAGIKTTGEPSESLLQAIRRAPVKAKAKTAAAAGAPPPALPRPVARPAEPARSPRLLAVQRALSDFGYGPLKRSGQMDTATKAAIEKFEREQRMPVTGQISDRLVRQLAAATGRPLEQ